MKYKYAMTKDRNDALPKTPMYKTAPFSEYLYKNKLQKTAAMNVKMRYTLMI